MDYLKYLNFPALIINNYGEVVQLSKPIKNKYDINKGDNFFSYCDDKTRLSEFILNFSNMSLGSNDKCLTYFNFSKKRIEIYVTLIQKNPTHLLIEFIKEHEVKVEDESFIKELIDNSGNLLSLVSKDYCYLSVNEQYSQKWGMPAEEIVNNHVSTVLGQEAFDKVVKKELDLCFSGKVRTYTDWFYSDYKKTMVFLKVEYHPVFDKTSGEVNSVAVTVTDITDIQIKNDMLSEQAFHDSLTNLDNRYSLVDYYQKITSTLTRNRSYCMVMIDLDGFKLINDQNGHATGDRLLKEFANELQSTLRQDDFCCRWGGDEFILLMAEDNTCQDNITRQHLNDRFSELQAKLYLVQNEEISLTFSFGLAFLSEQANKLDDLITIADNDMYEEKEKKKAKLS